MSKLYLKHFKKNKSGQDYVVGDIHGHFVNLKKLLQKISFNPEVDRLFSVGDLCDRGPHSDHIVEWLQYPWFYPVMGNHEEIILLYENNKVSEHTMYNLGTEWWLELAQDHKKIVVDTYKNLPLVIEVETKNGLVGILHAECPHADWKHVGAMLNNPLNSKAVSNCLWSTNSPLNNYAIKNVHAVFVGHMTQREHTINKNVYLIDTGSGYEGGYLTLFNLNTFEHHTQPC